MDKSTKLETQIWTRVSGNERLQVEKFMKLYGHRKLSSATRALIVKGLQSYSIVHN